MFMAAGFLSSGATCCCVGVTMVGVGSVCILASALAMEATLFKRRSLCLSVSASGGLPEVLRLAAGVVSFWEISLAAFPILTSGWIYWGSCWWSGWAVSRSRIDLSAKMIAAERCIQKC